MRMHRERGLALVLVLTVILALTIVATPFVLSMILQERTGTSARYESQADYGADGAKNYALWRLMQSLDPIERRSATGVFSSYTYDTDQEFDIRLDDIYLSKLKIADPKGAIWGLTVQDEQGKLNVRSAPVSALQTVSQLVDSRVVTLKDYLTMYSGRDTTWGCPQKIRAVGFQSGTPSGGVTVDNLHVLGPQSRVRVTKPGLKPIETIISGNAILGSSTQDGFTTQHSVAAYMDGVIEVEMRHPVNLNTARRETLVGMFEGLRWFNVPQSLVDRRAAYELATRFAGRDIQRLEQFLIALASTGLKTEQKLTVALNAVCPNAALLTGSGTVPVCFKSYDVYTLEAFSSMNNPAGAEMAGRGLREVVSVSPPTMLNRYCESQYDFNLMYSQVAVAMQNLQPKLAFSGYPFGSRMLTYPMPITAISDTALKPQQKPGPNGNEAYVTMLPAKDLRGRGYPQLERNLTGWQEQGWPRDHFDQELDGKKMNGGTLTYPWTQIFSLNHDIQQPPAFGAQQADISAGGFEIWVRFDGIANPINLFDIREQDSSNRLTLRVENGELILTACDGTIGIANDLMDNGMAEIRQPFSPQQDAWTHFGVYWKGTRYAHLAMLVDGFAHPQQKFGHYSPEGNKILTKLTSALTPTSTNLTLQDDSFLPSYDTPLLIGEEVVRYDKSSGTVIRGARGTQMLDHPSQVTVSIYGYSSKVRNFNVVADYGGAGQIQIPYSRIPTGGATLLYNFGLNPQADVAGDKQDPMTMQWQIDATQTDIGVITANIMDFPDQGYIRIQQEVIFYTARTTGGVGGMGTAKFTGCVRNQHGTTAVIHQTGANVQMWSVAVNNTTNYDSPTIIQVGDEWFGPVQRDTVRPTFWIGCWITVGQPLNLRRGNACFNTIQGAHSAGDRVIPTFRCRDVDPWPTGRESLGRGDWVTVMDAMNLKERARVRNTSLPQPTPQDPYPWSGSWNLPGGGQIAAFEDQVSRQYTADDLHVRILKFPSGELLGRNWMENQNPSVTIGPINGMVDEVKAMAWPKQGFYLAQQLDPSSLQTQLTAGAGMYMRGGLMKLGDEYIGYGQATNPAGPGLPVPLTQLKRGWLTSAGELHDRGDALFYLPWIPVSTLTNDLTPTDRVLYLNQELQGRVDKYTQGYALINNEMLLFEWNGGRGGNGMTLSMPGKHMDGQAGLYRGMFGTQPAGHSASNSLVYGMPFRYWDTYKPREFDNSMCYYQWSTKMDLARWRSFTWTQEILGSDPNVIVHALCRVDGKGEWYDAPGMNDSVLMVESVTPGSPVKINRTGYLNDAGQLDIRFYVEYRQGSFDPISPTNTHAWKRCPKIKEIRVEYDRPTQTLYHEDR